MCVAHTHTRTLVLVSTQDITACVCVSPAHILLLTPVYIYTQDITAWEKKYPGSAEEKEDVINFYNKVLTSFTGTKFLAYRYKGTNTDT